ncbi:MAG: threonine/serine dehydratase [Acidobacteria bacterium]|nr:threonine/serine dehydratase [Acidobacteriota bacterium]
MRQEIQAAHGRIRGWVRETPVMAMQAGAFGVNARMSLKLECLQVAGSFKPRGAFNQMLRGGLPAAGVVAASGGNHGAAVAYAARRVGTRAEIFVPGISPAAKRAVIERQGAELHVIPGQYMNAYEACQQRAAETGALLIHAYDQPATVEGQGTLALEWEQQQPDLDTVLVAVGGGGLIAGIAAWFERRVRVVAVEPEMCPALHDALRAGEPVDAAVGGMAADSLGARRIGSIAFEMSRQFVDRSVLVSESAIRDAQAALWREVRVAAEPGAAVSLAALMSGVYVPAPDEHVGVLVCGGNVALDSLQ